MYAVCILVIESIGYCTKKWNYAEFYAWYQIITKTITWQVWNLHWIVSY